MFDNYPTIPYVGFKDENVKTPITFTAQHQDVQPGMEYEMNPLPIYILQVMIQDMLLVK